MENEMPKQLTLMDLLLEYAVKQALNCKEGMAHEVAKLCYEKQSGIVCHDKKHFVCRK